MVSAKMDCIALAEIQVDTTTPRAVLPAECALRGAIVEAPRSVNNRS